MSACHPFRPVPGQCGPNRRGPLPAPPFDPRDYWATRKCVSRLSASLEAKLDKADVVDPGAEAEAGQAADAKSTHEELGRIIAKLAEKADKATTLAGYGITDAATKTEIAAKADLVGGKVPAAQLPSYVDDVLEYDAKSAFPATGESGKIYVAKDTNLTYRWSGTQYVEISPSPVLDDEVTEASPNGVKSSGIWSWVKSLLPHWLTSDYAEPATVASVANKRDKTDLDVYDFTEWSGVPTGYYIKFDEEFKWAMRSSATDAMVGATVGSETDLRVVFGADDWSGGYEFTATRSTVPTFDTLAKKSELTAGLAVKRDKTDLDVYDVTEWTFAPALPDSYEIRYRDDLGGWGVYYNGEFAGAVKGSYDSLEISWDGNEWGGGYPFTATRSCIQTADTLATTNGVNAAIEAHHDDTKRDKTDLDIKLPSIESCTWGTPDTELRDALIGVVPVFSNGKWSAVAGQWTSNLVPGTGYEESISFLFSGLRDDVPANATLVRGEPETVDNIAKKSELTAGLAAKQDKITASGILKGDGQGGVNEATKSSTSADPANADYRDPQDNTCHKTELTEWVFSDGVARTLYHNQNPQSNLWYWNNFSQTWDGTDAPPDGSLVAITESESDTFLEFNGGLIGLTATRSKVCTSNELYTTTGYVDGKVSAAVSTKYTKPSGGIPASDLALTVQSSLDAADAAAPQATTYTKAETDAAIRAGASLGQMTNLGNGRYEYTGALADASTQTYPREEA